MKHKEKNEKEKKIRNLKITGKVFLGCIVIGGPIIAGSIAASHKFDSLLHQTENNVFDVYRQIQAEKGIGVLGSSLTDGILKTTLNINQNQLYNSLIASYPKMDWGTDAQLQAFASELNNVNKEDKQTQTAVLGMALVYAAQMQKTDLMEKLLENCPQAHKIRFRVTQNGVPISLNAMLSADVRVDFDTDTYIKKWDSYRDINAIKQVEAQLDAKDRRR